MILSFMFGIVGLASFQNKVSAANISAGPLEISYSGDKIFDELNYAPVDSTAKVITVKNNGSIAHSLAIATRNVSGDLAPYLMLQPTIGSAIWSLSIADLAALPTQSKTVISSIGPGQTVNFDLVASLNNVGNDSQNKNVTFDLVFGTQEAEPIVSSPTATTNNGGAIANITLATRRVATTLTNRSALAVVTASSVSSPVVSASSTVTTDETTGEVKGAQTGGGQTGEDWRLLLIVPILGILGGFLLKTSPWRNLVVPIAGGIIALILSFIYKANFSIFWFYIILIVETVIFVFLEYIVRREKRESKSTKK
jgi:hypothetical protein